MDKFVSSYSIRGGASVLALNAADNRLIAAGQQTFFLFAIELIDNTEQFVEINDFRNTPSPSAALRWSALQPKDVAWNPHDDNCFATASGTNGCLYMWDANRRMITHTLNIHNAIINRILFHPKYPNVLLTASQDGYGKLIDFRINDTGKILNTFRHSSKEGFRDIDINLSDTDKFAAVINDQYSVPIWDIRQPNQLESCVPTRDKVLSIAWNPHERSWLATGGIGGHDRTIRVWDTKEIGNRQGALFAVYTFGQVTKLSWRPSERYQIACFTRTTDPRIHLWDVRRAYLPQMSFCHHRNEIEDFLWRSNSNQMISVGRDERLIHSHISSAIRSEQLVSLLSLNITSNGSIHLTMPNIDNDYVHSLYQQKHLPLSSSSLIQCYSYEIMRKSINWNKIIKGKSILGIYTNVLPDQSIRIFHQFARRWTLGNGEKSLIDLAQICDVNGNVAEELNRPDLQATWQIVKMLFANKDISLQSSKNSRSFTKSHRISDPFSGHRHYHHHHHHYHYHGKKITSAEKQQQQGRFNEENQSHEQKILSNSKLDMIDETDTYIVRDVLTDDLIFLTPDELLQNSNNDLILYNSQPDSDIIDEQFLNILGNRIYHQSSSRKYSELIFIDDDGELESNDEYENDNSNMQTSTHSMIPDGSDKFLTIDENYCPTMEHKKLNFDQILRQTLNYYVENNELQMAIHLLLALFPQLSEQKRIDLFNGTHLQWLTMYIELLQKMRLFIKAIQVMKHCVEKENILLNYNSTEYDGAIIFTAQAPIFKRLPVIASPTGSSTNKNILPILKEFVCTICRIPCRGLFSFCGVCFHGGHIDHIERWFRTHDECPHGCGHRCTDHDRQNSRGGITQRFIRKSSSNFQ